MSAIDFDIVLPCYNPQKNWAFTIAESCEKLDALLDGAKYRLIIVNDGSKKGITQEAVQYLKEKIEEVQFFSYEINKGKGFALRTGVMYSTAPVTIVTDIDFPYFEENIVSFYRRLSEGEVDILCGTRNDFYYRDVPPLRRTISKNLKKLNRRFLRLKVDDTQCGLKGFNNIGKSIFLQTSINRYLFDLEFIFLASTDPTVQIEGQRVSLKPNIIFSKMNMKIILGEGYNFLKIFIKNLFGIKRKNPANRVSRNEALVMDTVNSAGMEPADKRKAGY